MILGTSVSHLNIEQFDLQTGLASLLDFCEARKVFSLLSFHQLHVGCSRGIISQFQCKFYPLLGIKIGRSCIFWVVVV